jgi:hypothetical protein
MFEIVIFKFQLILLMILNIAHVQICRLKFWFDI